MNSTLRARPLAPEAARISAGLNNHGLKLYLLFVASWFLHLPARLPILGAIRFDLLLVVLMAFMAFMNRTGAGEPRSEVEKRLRILIAYSILVIPLVQWPGSVINSGIPDLVKVVSFYYFSIAFIRTERDLKQFIAVFVGCQLWRIMEPLYLHITTGYWGDRAYQAGGEFLARLSGAPHDVVNPNGLAFIICTTIAFIYFLGRFSMTRRLVFLAITPLCLYALALTGSRSGLIGLAIVLIGIAAKSKKRVVPLIIGVAIVVFGFSWLSPDMQDRYLSVVGMGYKNEATARGRFEAIEKDIEVVVRRPLFGHGLGTSREANYHFGGRDQPSHNMYLEVAEELGVVGLVVFIMFVAAIFRGFFQLRDKLRTAEVSPFVQHIVDALQVWLALEFVSSFASYGLMSYTWYLAGGLLIVIERQIPPKAAMADPVDKSKQLQPLYQRHRRASMPAADVASAGHYRRI